jgi:hypothetical protein
VEFVVGFCSTRPPLIVTHCDRKKNRTTTTPIEFCLLEGPTTDTAAHV